MPSIADELATELNTPRLRAARSRRYGLVWDSLVESLRMSLAAEDDQKPETLSGSSTLSYGNWGWLAPWCGGEGAPYLEYEQRIGIILEVERDRSSHLS